MGSVHAVVKLNSRNQIVIPTDIREKLGIGAGDTLILYIVGDEMVLIPEPESWTEFSRGLGSEIWEGVDPVEYVRELRGVCPE